MLADNNPLTGRPLAVFFYYAVPSVIGLLSLSSASVITAIFMGNFVGTAALAAVNLTMPAVALLFALAFMLAVGGSVIAGKRLGEQDIEGASDVFSKIMLLAAVSSIVIVLTGWWQIDNLVHLLGANDEVFPLVKTYLQILMIAGPVATVGYVFYYFVMVDGQPVLACIALVSVAIVDIALNWLFVVQLGHGIAGAGWALACAQFSMIVILLPHLFKQRGQLRLQRPKGSWRPIGRAAVNGVSEFTNELSVGVVVLLFNWVLIRRFGTDGVAAFTVVEYVMFIGVMISYGFSDALQPLVSKSLGAKSRDRILVYFRIGLSSALVIGVLMSVLLYQVPELLIGAFLQESAEQTMHIAMQFAAYFWPVPIFIAANVILTSFFTATDQPLPSGSVALSRSLLLPAGLLLLLPGLIGDLGVFITIPLAEFVTLLLATYLLFFHSRIKLLAPLSEKPD